jgi:hypothetical protein
MWEMAVFNLVDVLEFGCCCGCSLSAGLHGLSPSLSNDLCQWNAHPDSLVV